MSGFAASDLSSEMERSSENDARSLVTKIRKGMRLNVHDLIDKDDGTLLNYQDVENVRIFFLLSSYI